MFNTDEIKDYLQYRSIGEILSRLNGKENDETALKFIIIIDYELAKNHLYKKKK